MEKKLEVNVKVPGKVDLTIYRKVRKSEYVSAFEQKFRDKRPVYKLDEKTKKLVVIDEEDIQKLLDSNKDCALNKVLDRFLATGVVDSGVMASAPVFDNELEVEDGSNHDDLIEAADAINNLTALREKYHFDDKMSYGEMIKVLTAKNNGLVDKIQDAVKEVKVKDEKKETQPKGEQKEL